MNFKAKKNTFRVLIYVLMFMMPAVQAYSQERTMEKLNRGLVAIKSENGVFLSWRKFKLDPTGTTFNVYRNDSLVNAFPIAVVSNYLDQAGTPESYYHIEALFDREVIEISETVVVWENGYFDIPLQTPAGYKPNDASVADLDGDGDLEIVVKMQGTTKDNAQSGFTDPVYLHAYEMDGTHLWSIDLGINIRAGAHYTQFMVYDLNGDGYAELACKTAPGTKDGTGNFLSDGLAASDDDSADYRNSNGYILDGPEYLTLFNGQTGAEISTVEYVPVRGNVADWGDSYGNRVDRFLACVAYFGSTPSLVMARGYYTRTVLAAWDYSGGELVQRWVFDTDDEGVGADGNPYSLYEGQGAHSLSVGDVDNDGYDEIVYGAMTVDHDGTGLYTTGNNHGDATHLGDFLPERPGLEFFMPSESAFSTNQVTGEPIPGIYLTDASNGEIIWQKDVNGPADVGRAMTADVSAEHPGYEFWAANPLYNLYDQDGNIINFTVEGPSINFGSWWDGDLQREVLSGNAIKKWTPEMKVSLLEPEECESNNGTKATPALSGDILGDWREEVIWRTSDNQNLRVFSTTCATQYGLNTLLEDPQYRLALVWQNVGYNQPPHPGFYLGGGMPGQVEPFVYTEPGDGITVMEAEVYYDLLPRSGACWFENNTFPGASNNAYMQSPDINSFTGTNDYILNNSPGVRYRINFTQTGNHYWYALVSYPDEYSDSYHLGLNGNILLQHMTPYGDVEANTWGWSDHNSGNNMAVFDVPAVGQYDLVVYMREPNFRIDKIIVVSDPSNSPLPIELITFDVTQADDDVVINWSTKNEINCKGYALMHSADGINWKEITYVQPQSSLVDISDTYYYQFIHENYVPGDNYYQLIQHDLDGQHMRSLIRQIHMENNITPSDLLIYPTVTEKILNVKIPEPEFSYEYAIFNQLGQKKLQGNLSGAGIHKIDLEDLPAGSYFINFFTGNNEHLSYTFIKNTP